MDLFFEIYPRLLGKGSICAAYAVTEVNTLPKINEEFFCGFTVRIAFRFGLSFIFLGAGGFLVWFLRWLVV